MCKEYDCGAYKILMKKVNKLLFLIKRNFFLKNKNLNFIK